MRTNTVRTILLAASMGLVACGETDLIPGELSQAEAEDLAGVLMFTTLDATASEPAPAAAGPQLAPYVHEDAISTTVECPLGGTVAVSADVRVEGDTDSEAFAAHYGMTQVHHECGVASENDRRFTLWGAPDLTLDLLVGSNGQGVVEWGGSVVGAVAWVSDGREGTCEVSLEFSARVEAETSVDAEMAGVVCGFEISRTLTVG